MTGAPKTIDDLPHFKVSAIRQGENRDGGRTDSELTGVFDRTEGVNEGRCWLLLPRKDGQESQLSRYYPVFTDGRTTLPPIGPDGVIRGGWDHVHCEICDAHIVAESYGYIDPGEHWICEACYGRYVVSHDLSFIKT